MATSPRIHLHTPGTTLVLLTLCFAPLVAIQFTAGAASIPVAAAIIAWIWTEITLSRSSSNAERSVEDDPRVVRETSHQEAIAWVVVFAVSLWAYLLV